MLSGKRWGLLAAGALMALACRSKPTTPGVAFLSISKILAFGDSLTEGEATPSDFNPFFVHPTNDPGPAKGYPYKLLTLLTQRYPRQTMAVYNGGYGGRFLNADALDKPDRTLDEFLDAFHPEVMILLHGTNDVNQVTVDVKAVAALAGILIDKAQSRGTKVILSSLPPRIPGGNPNRALDPAPLVPYNAELAALAAQKGVPFVDIYPLIIQNLAGPDIAPDGLHLTQAGNDKLAAAYFQAIRLRYEIYK